MRVISRINIPAHLVQRVVSSVKATNTVLKHGMNQTRYIAKELLHEHTFWGLICASLCHRPAGVPNWTRIAAWSCNKPEIRKSHFQL